MYVQVLVQNQEQRKLLVKNVMDVEVLEFKDKVFLEQLFLKNYVMNVMVLVKLQKKNAKNVKEKNLFL